MFNLPEDTHMETYIVHRPFIVHRPHNNMLCSYSAYHFVCNRIRFIHCTTSSRICCTTQAILRQQRSANIHVELKWTEKKKNNENRLVAEIEDIVGGWNERKNAIRWWIIELDSTKKRQNRRWRGARVCNEMKTQTKSAKFVTWNGNVIQLSSSNLRIGAFFPSSLTRHQKETFARCIHWTTVWRLQFRNIYRLLEHYSLPTHTY